MEPGLPLWIGAVLSALIAATVTAVGWWVSHERDRRAAERARREKIVDVQKALRAEIAAHLLALEEDEAQNGGYAPRLDALRDRLAAEPGFKPIVPREKHDTVFAALVGQIDLLPSEAVEPVVAYYSHLATLSAMIEDLRSGPLRNLEGDRLLAAFRDMVALKRRALVLAQRALAALDAGIAATRDPDRWVSTRAAGPDGPAAPPSGPSDRP